MFVCNYPENTRCIRSIKNIKIQQPAACNLTINQGTKPPSCGTMSAQTQLSTRPDSADSANLAISPLSAVVCTVLYCTVLHCTALYLQLSGENQDNLATGGVLAAGKSSWEECWSVGVLAVAGTLRHVLARCHTSRHWVVQSGVDRRLSFCCLRVSRVSI